MEAQPLRGDPEPAPRPGQYQSTATAAPEPSQPAADAKSNSSNDNSNSVESSRPGGGPGGEDSEWECSICFESLKDPVCTSCGHLFCWPCLYRWMNTGKTTCPVCKAGVTRENVIPIYTRCSRTDPRTRDIPDRPAGQRPVPERPAQPRQGQGGQGQGQFGGLTFSAGVGFFPSLLGLQFQSFTSNGQGAVDNRPLTPEELAQLNTSRFLMMLGSFVMICLIFF